MFKKLIILTFLFSSFNLIPFIADAHPHVFIDYKITVVFAKDTFKSIKMHWDMDDMTSTNFIEEFDVNKNGVLDKTELSKMKTTTFINLKKSDYFTNISINDKKISIPQIKVFNVIYQDNLIKYSFDINFNLKATEKVQKVEIDLIDKTNYVAFNPIDKRVDYKKSDKIAYLNIEPNSIEEQKVLFKFNRK